MPSWSGWQQQFLKAASLPTDTANVNFLSDWQAHSNTECGNNPIDVSHALGGSSNCQLLQGTNRHAQKYGSHAAAATAFGDQINSGNFPDLLAALKSGKPYNYSKPNGVTHDLVKWGSGIFEIFYQDKVNPTAGQGPSGVNLSSPHAHAGWSSLRKSFNQSMPAALKSADKSVRRARQSLARARKVGG